MQAPARRQALARLAARLDGLEKGLGTPPRDEARAPFARLDPGALHEMHAAERDSGALWSFALGQAAAHLRPDRPAILWLGLSRQAARTGLPYPPGFSAFGIGPEALAFGFARSPRDLLWAGEEAVASPALAAVVAELAGAAPALDFTATRRLSLRASRSGTPFFLLRPAAPAQPSAARTRWRIAPWPGAPDPFDPAAPGPPLWRAILEKGPRGQEGSWILSWSDRAFTASETDHDRTPTPAPQPHPHALVPLLGHRLRRTG